MRRAVALVGFAVVASTLAAVAQAQRDPRAELVPRPLNRIVAHPNGVPLRTPNGVFFDANVGELYVADTGNDLIAIFDPGGVPRFTFGSEAGLREPRKVIVDSRGRIYVIGRRPGVEVYSYRGEPLGAFPFDPSHGEGEIRVAGMAIGPGGRLLFVDQSGPQVLVYDLNWQLRFKFGHRGDSRGAFRAPVDLAVGPRGAIHVVDRIGIPVQVFSPEGRLRRSWGKHDLGPGDFSGPSAVAVDAQGRVFVADVLRQDIKVFDSKGEFVLRFGGYGTGAGQVAYPVDLAISPDQKLYVCEQVGRRVQFFQIPEAPGDK